MSTSVVIPLQEPAVNILRQCGPTLSDVLQSKFGCVAIIEGVDFEQDPRRPKVVPEKRFTGSLRRGVKVSVWKDDLTNVRVDAVVNAANTKLQHYGGLAQALSFAGGSQIQRDSDNHIKMYGDLETGDAIIVSPGLLPCKKLIHAVGPYLPPHPSQFEVADAQVLLKKTIRSILDQVQKHHIKTVAIPAISSGLFNFPLPLCANTIMSTVKDYYEKQTAGHRPEEILLVNNDEPTVKEMERVCCEMLGSHPPMTYSNAAAAKTSPPVVHIGNILLTLKYGRIEEEQTDVIVNTASSDCELSAGKISAALLQRAGPGIQKEIKEKPIQGHIIVTKGHHLQCKQVYHTFCTGKGHSAAQQILFVSVLDCLWMAVSNQHRSIAFPAIGTGALGFSSREAAQIMSDAVADFALKSNNQLEVFFVIFPRDKDTFKAFEQVMASLRQKASSPSFAQGIMQSNRFHDNKPPIPNISLTSPSDELTHEARRWFTDLLHSSGAITICNNFIQHFGEKEYEQLCHLTKKGILIEESFEKGHSEMKLNGDSFDVVVAALQVEAMLCNTQRDFVREEESAMMVMLDDNVSFRRKTVDRQSSEFTHRSSEFRKEGLRIVKLERVENPALNMIFDLKIRQLKCMTPEKMFQRIPAQFCEMVSNIGFHAECAPPADPAFGEGIYFSRTVKKAMEVWKQQKEEYVYFVEADVLTGKSTPGKPGLILPPAMQNNPHNLFDSVSGGPDVSVIFSGYQALPKYIITCEVV